MPTEEREPAWRRACLYHAWRQAGASDHEAHETVVAAVQTVLLLPWKDASIEAVNAIACATPSSSRVVLAGAQHTERWRAKVPDNLNGRARRH